MRWLGKVVGSNSSKLHYTKPSLKTECYILYVLAGRYLGKSGADHYIIVSIFPILSALYNELILKCHSVPTV